MVDLLEQRTAAAWIGMEPWSKAATAEWFLSVNRWLQGRERDIMVRGLIAARLL
jgi:hypothetical protein